MPTIAEHIALIKDNKRLKAELESLKMEFLYCGLDTKNLKAAQVLDIHARREKLLRATMQPFIDRAEKAEATNKRLRDALEFYANKDNYEPQVSDAGCGCCSDTLMSKIDMDDGDKAKQALEGGGG